jgi:hypothetical protein
VNSERTWYQSVEPVSPAVDWHRDTREERRLRRGAERDRPTVFSSPTAPERTAFESTRSPFGSFSVIDAMVTIVPRRRPGDAVPLP